MTTTLLNDQFLASPIRVVSPREEATIRSLVVVTGLGWWWCGRVRSSLPRSIGKQQRQIVEAAWPPLSRPLSVSYKPGTISEEVFNLILSNLRAHLSPMSLLLLCSNLKYPLYLRATKTTCRDYIDLSNARERNARSGLAENKGCTERAAGPR